MSAASRFLSRWSRLKRGAEAPPVEPVHPAETVEQPTLPQEGEAPAPAAAEPSEGTPEPLALPPLESLGVHADISGYLRKEVSESLRRAALRKLFSDPHFNQMDGLDVYVDDYSVSAPIPDDVMKRLRQFQTFLEDDKPVAAEAADAATEAAPRPASPEAGETEAQPPSDAAQHGPRADMDACSAPECDSLTGDGQKVALNGVEPEKPQKKADSSA